MNISINVKKDEERRSRSRSPISSLIKGFQSVDLGWNADKHWAWHVATNRWWIYFENKWWTQWCKHRNDPDSYWISLADWESKRWDNEWRWHHETKRYWIFQWAAWWTKVVEYENGIEKSDHVQWINYERWISDNRDDKVKEMDTSF